MSKKVEKQIPVDIFQRLDTSEHGLSQKEAQRRLNEYGYNKLPEAKTDSLLVIFLRQFQGPLIYILLVASVIVFLMGESIDGAIILFVLIFNAVVGTFQEGRAQNTLSALKKFTETRATVLRDGKEYIIPDAEITVGDIIILQEGEKIPADAEIISAQNLKINESAITGESIPVYKNIILENSESKEGQDKNTKNQNIVFKGTFVVAGNGRAVITQTGINTVIGKIAEKISQIDSDIPLKTNIKNLSRLIVTTVIVISILLFTIGLATGKSAIEMFSTVVSLSVSIIPEGLPIVMTLVLASGVSRMSKRNALVKKLQAVEALGQASVIAVDKTGTLTKNEIVVQKIYTAGKIFEIDGIGYEPKGNFTLDGKIIEAVNHPELLNVGRITALCSSARVMFLEEKKEWRVSGDPTEAATLVLSQKIGFQREDLLHESPLLTELPFDYQLKYHAVLNKVNNKNFLSVIGASEIILGLSKKIKTEDKDRTLLKKDRIELEKIFSEMSAQGLRVVAIAEKQIHASALENKDVENLVFVGFIGMKDALRAEVADAMQKSISAGIKVVMITGDHKITAEAIAREAGIYHDGDTILTGEDIDSFNSATLALKVASTSVFARVTPDHKMRIVDAYQERGEIIAMTGDGVNDAPSLVSADLGVAMGKIGTEVAKEASDIVLLDDNFGSIVSAVEEGRRIYRTIKKVILYLFSTSLGEVFVITGALILAMPLPILPAQIIWLNLVTDGFLDVTLAMEPKEKGLLSSKFERPKKYLVDRLMLYRMILMAIPMAIGTLLLFSHYYEADIQKAWTMSLTLLAAFQWFNVWNCRSESDSIFKTNIFSNMYLFYATLLVVGLQFLAIYNSFMQKILRTVPLELKDWLIIIAIAFSIIIVEEIRKYFYRKKHLMI